MSEMWEIDVKSQRFSELFLATTMYGDDTCLIQLWHHLIMTERRKEM